LRVARNTVSAVPPSKEGWTHCRKLWVEALPSGRKAMDIIDPVICSGMKTCSV